MNAASDAKRQASGHALSAVSETVSQWWKEFLDRMSERLSAANDQFCKILDAERKLFSTPKTITAASKMSSSSAMGLLIQLGDLKSLQIIERRSAVFLDPATGRASLQLPHHAPADSPLLDVSPDGNSMTLNGRNYFTNQAIQLGSETYVIKLFGSPKKDWNVIE